MKQVMRDITCTECEGGHNELPNGILQDGCSPYTSVEIARRMDCLNRRIKAAYVNPKEDQMKERAKVKFYRSENAFCIETTHTDTMAFLSETATAIGNMITDPQDSMEYFASDWSHQLRNWLPHIVEIASKLKGYKAEVEVEQIIRAGSLPPIETQTVWPRRIDVQATV